VGRLLESPDSLAAPAVREPGWDGAASARDVYKWAVTDKLAGRRRKSPAPAETRVGNRPVLGWATGRVSELKVTAQREYPDETALL
jgi:hypothetical protein